MSNIFLLWVSLTPGGTVLTDSSLSPAVQSLTLSSDQLVSCGLLVLQPPESAPCLLERSLNTSCSNHTISWCCSGVKNQVLCLLHRTTNKLKYIFLHNLLFTWREHRSFVQNNQCQVYSAELQILLTFDHLQRWSTDSRWLVRLVSNVFWLVSCGTWCRMQSCGRETVQRRCTASHKQSHQWLWWLWCPGIWEYNHLDHNHHETHLTWGKRCQFSCMSSWVVLMEHNCSPGTPCLCWSWSCRAESSWSHVTENRSSWQYYSLQTNKRNWNKTC